MKIYTCNCEFDSGLLCFYFNEDLKQFPNRIQQLKSNGIKFQNEKCVCDKLWVYQIESDYFTVCSNFIINFFKLNDLTPFLSAFYDNC